MINARSDLRSSFRFRTVLHAFTKVLLLQLRLQIFRHSIATQPTSFCSAERVSPHSDPNLEPARFLPQIHHCSYAALLAECRLSVVHRLRLLLAIDPVRTAAKLHLVLCGSASCFSPALACFAPLLQDCCCLLVRSALCRFSEQAIWRNHRRCCLLLETHFCGCQCRMGKIFTEKYGTQTIPETMSAPLDGIRRDYRCVAGILQINNTARS